MKRVFRIFGGISIFFGVLCLLSGIYAIIRSLFSGEIENLPIFLFSMLFLAAAGVGLIYLGYQPFRKPGNKTENVPSASSLSRPAPPAPHRLAEKEREHQDLEAEERKRQWKEADEQRKKARAEFLKPWQEIDPADVENIKLWEDSLEKDCAMSEHYVFRGQGDDGLDGTRDYTGVDWFLLHCDSDLKKAIQLYAQIDTYRKACEVHNCRVPHTENHILRSLMAISHDRRILLLPSEVQFAALGKDEETCMALCRKHGLMIMRSEENDRYYNYVDGTSYIVYVGATFPGSADDAATYGALYLDTV